MRLKQPDKAADAWLMPNVRGMAGVLGSGLSMVAAGIAALILVSVLLAFHGWPTNTSTGSVPPVVVASPTPATHVPQLVLGKPAPARSASAAGTHTRAVSQAPTHAGTPNSNNLTTFSDANRPKGQSPVPGKKPPGVCNCPVQPVNPLPPDVSKFIDSVPPTANDLGQQISQGLSNTGTTLSGALVGVSAAVANTLARH